METWVKIIELLVWPTTIVIVVMLMRSPLSKLIPTLKKLKYKDLEMEFEREANKILSEAERDLPEIPEIPEMPKLQDDTRALYSKRRIEPAIVILESWRSLESEMREIANHQNIQAGRSIRSLISELESNGLISKEAAKVSLDLAALRNKVAHASEETITYEVSAAFCSSVERVKSAMRVENT